MTITGTLQLCGTASLWNAKVGLEDTIFKVHKEINDIAMAVDIFFLFLCLKISILVKAI